APQINVVIDGDSTQFPEAVTNLKVEDRGSEEIITDDYGVLSLASFVCRKAASANFEGLHQVHLVANGRTVVTRKIDGLIGVGRFGADQNLVYHGCVTGPFLDDRVNQERTQFNFAEDVVEEVVKTCAGVVRDRVLSNEIQRYDSERLETMKGFT